MRRMGLAHLPTNWLKIMDFMVDGGNKHSPQSHRSPKRSQNLAFPCLGPRLGELSKLPPVAANQKSQGPPPFWTVLDVSQITCQNFSWQVRKPAYQPRLLGFSRHFRVPAFLRTHQRLVWVGPRWCLHIHP